MRIVRVVHQKDLEDLLDRSIQAGEYVMPPQKKVKDLSALNADALAQFFAGLENKNLQAESLSSELTAKIEELVKKNKKRAHFMKRLNSILEEYNSGAHDIDQFFDELMDLAKSLTEEEQRAVKEGLTEEELAIFDLLQKDPLNPDEVEKVREVARELLAKLKEERLVSDWREFDPLRAGVKTTIDRILWADLPQPTYTEMDCQIKGLEVYNFVYEHYRDAENFVYA